MTINPLDNPYGTVLGLMDEVYGPGTAKALEKCGGPWEAWRGGLWGPADGCYFDPWHVYRKKPAPPKPVWPEELWANFYPTSDIPSVWLTKEIADAFASQYRIACVRYVPAPEEKE